MGKLENSEERKEDTGKWKDLPCLWIVKLAILTKEPADSLQPSLQKLKTKVVNSYGNTKHPD